MDSDLERIRSKASREPKLRFTSLYHHVTDKEKLLHSYILIESDAAAGVDGVKANEYAEELGSNLEDLSERLGRMGYRPQPVRRTYIPKAGSKKKRPLGIPTVEDKVVQMAVTRV
jgi:RNA-directed DNA polymerase